MSESDIWSVFMVNGPISGLFCWPGVLPEDAEAVRSLVSRGLPLPIVPARLVVEGSGLVSRSSSDWDFLGVVVAFFDFLANFPSGPLGPIPLFVGCCWLFAVPVRGEQNIKSTVLIRNWSNAIQLDVFVRWA